jgi:hypothetical protein
MMDPVPGVFTERAWLSVGTRVFQLGPITAATPQELCDELAARLELLADTLRGPKATPAEPCEGCGVDMVRRRGHPGRYTIVSRDDDGEVAIFGIHDVTGCLMERERIQRVGPAWG